VEVASVQISLRNQGLRDGRRDYVIADMWAATTMHLTYLQTYV